MILNGNKLKLQKSMILSDFLTDNEYSTAYIAVEINGEIIKKSDFDSTFLNDTDIVEIVRFVGGG